MTDCQSFAEFSPWLLEQIINIQYLFFSVFHKRSTSCPKYIAIMKKSEKLIKIKRRILGTLLLTTSDTEPGQTLKCTNSITSIDQIMPKTWRLWRGVYYTRRVVDHQASVSIYPATPFTTPQPNQTKPPGSLEFEAARERGNVRILQIVYNSSIYLLFTASLHR